MATEEDVTLMRDSQRRIVELVDGILLEKTMGSRESEIAALLIRIFGNYVQPRKIGRVLGEAGMYRLKSGLVRIPDVSFLSQERYTSVADIKDQRIWAVVPNLSIEVISESNSQKEMDDKLNECFEFGVEEVWYVTPFDRTIRVFYKLDESVTVDAASNFEHSRLFPELQFSVQEIFAE
jgi:Uma2 family endonuclease